MATDPQDAPRHARQVVRRVLRRRNIAIDAETAQLVAAAAQTALRAVRPPGSRAEGRVFLPPAASGCSDTAAAMARTERASPLGQCLVPRVTGRQVHPFFLR